MTSSHKWILWLIPDRAKETGKVSIWHFCLYHGRYTLCLSPTQGGKIQTWERVSDTEQPKEGKTFTYLLINQKRGKYSNLFSSPVGRHDHIQQEHKYSTHPGGYWNTFITVPISWISHWIMLWSSTISIGSQFTTFLHQGFVVIQELTQPPFSLWFPFSGTY